MGLFDKLTDKLTGRVGEFIDEVMIPEDVHLNIERAARAIGREDFDGAQDLLELVERTRPGLARTHHLLGRVWLAKGAPQEAARALRKALEVREDASSHLWAGLAMEQMHEWRGALMHLRSAQKLMDRQGDQAFDVHVALGRVHLEMGRADKAINEFRKALKHRPADVETSVALAKGLLARDQAEAAQEVLDSLEAPLSDANSRMVVAQAARARGLTERALRAYEAASQDNAASNELRRRAHVGIAELLIPAYGSGRMPTSQVDEARAHVAHAQALVQGEEGNDIIMILAHLAWHEGDQHAALSHAQRVNSRDPAHGLATVMLGEMLLELKDTEQAENFFRKALGADHDHQEARAMLGIARCHVHKQDWSGARQWAAQGLKLTHNNVAQAELLHTLGVAALAQGDAARALVEFQTAKQRAPSLATDIEHDMARALNALRPDWSGLPTQLDDPVALSQTLTALRDYVARDTRLVDFLAPIQDMIDTINAPLSIAIVGEFNAGKSTLINALVGEDIVPMGVLPTTAHTGVIQYGPRQTARVHYVSGEVQEVGFDEAKRQMKTNSEDIDHLDYLYPHPQLRTVNFWDTPGFNALEARHEVVAQRALEQAEAILWMLDANQVLSQTEFDRIESVPQGNQRLLVLINKIDRLGPEGPQRDEAIEHLVEYVEDFAGEHIAGIFPVSALMALKGEDGGVDAFRAHLQTQIIDRAGMIKTLEGRRHMTRVVVTLQAFGQGLLLRYEHLAQDVEDATQWLDRLRSRHPQHEALNQLMQVEDRMDFMLQGVVKEVQEALTPKSTWINTKMVLSEEDRDFISTLLMERFDSVLEHSLQRVMADVASLEGEVAGHIGPVMQQLSLQDARAVSQRLDGFRDEVRVLKMLLQERVYGRLRARANGQIDAASSGAMESIALSADPARWKGILRRLLPELRPGFQDTLEQWYADFFDAGDRVLEHLRRDLQLLKLEAKHRYDTSAVETLCGLDLDLEPEDELV